MIYNVIKTANAKSPSGKTPFSDQELTIKTMEQKYNSPNTVLYICD